MFLGSTTAPGATLAAGSPPGAPEGADTIGRCIVASGLPWCSVTGAAFGAALWEFRG